MAPSDFESLLDRVEQMRRFRHDSAVAPHKPLVALYALARLRDGASTIAFAETVDVVAPLISRYWQRVGEPRIEEPFVRLAGDGFWHLEFDRAAIETPSGSLSAAKLRAIDARAGFNALSRSLLLEKRARIGWIARILLFETYPEVDPATAAEALGLDV